jgi:cytochrome c553
MADHLSDHFAKVSEAREALIEGDLGKAKEIASTLESMDPVTALPPSWRPWIGDTRAAAMRVRDATTVEAAAAGIAEAALACAECHEEKGFQLQQPPDRPHSGAPDAMWRVRQAEDALWFGLTAPDAAQWRFGAVALAGDPLLSDTARWAALRPAEEQMKRMASTAATARDLEERGRAYGRLLAACATCHVEERPE